MRPISNLYRRVLLAGALNLLLAGGTTVAKDSVRHPLEILAVDYVGMSEKPIPSIILGTSEAGVAKFRRRYSDGLGHFYPTKETVIDRDALRPLLLDVGLGSGGFHKMKREDAILKVTTVIGGKTRRELYGKEKGLIVLANIARDCRSPAKACSDISEFNESVRRYLGLLPKR
jgi:hypothetical protein